MRSSTPILSVTANVGPNSPPQTPLSAAHPPPFWLNRKISPRVSPGPGPGPGSAGFAPPDIRATIVPQSAVILPAEVGQPTFTIPVRPEDLSPLSTDTSTAELSDTEDQSSDDDVLRGSPVPPTDPYPPRFYGQGKVASQPRVVGQCNFVIEELSDFDEDDMEGRTDVIHPSTIEEAGLDDPNLDQHVIKNLQSLHVRNPASDSDSDSESESKSESSSDESDLADDDVFRNIKAARLQQRQSRMSHSSIGTKRTKSEMGSDSDREDARRNLNFDDLGSSAKRLKRRPGDRRSLIFQDPPPRIDEAVEPEELEDGETLARELPFYEYITMEVDSPRST